MEKSLKEIEVLIQTINFELNGIQISKSVPANWTLLRFIREDLGFIGTKCGCEIGECGACAVLYNGEAVNSCLMLAPQINGAVIWTIEGITPAGGKKLHPVQKAFIEHDAVHCGFCSPGMIMTTIALLLKNKNPDENEIKTALAGNLCRCTGYIQIIEAVRKAGALITDNELSQFSAKNGLK